MTRALVYLQLTSLKNSVLERMRRLKNPRYVLAVVVGAAYFYFLIFRKAGHSPPPPALDSGPITHVGGFLELAGAAVLFVAVVLAWILPKSRAALNFTEAEIGFLFPAPISRGALVQYKLVKLLFGSVFYSLFMILLSRWFSRSGSTLYHTLGWCLILSLYNLHLVGASFWRERIVQYGITPFRRRVLGCGFLLALFGATWIGMQRALPPRSNNDLQNVISLIDYLKSALSSAPLIWVLTPFRWVVRPFFAQSAGAFFATAWPAVLFIVLHYVWALRSAVAFEEASVINAEKRAEAYASMRAGRWPGRTPARKRREPFVLLPDGFPSIAFLWKGLIAAGPAYYPRYWFLIGAVLGGGVMWLGGNPDYRPFVGGIAAVSGALCLYGLLFGPMVARRGLALMLERMDLAKSYPLRGWQVVLGEMLSSIVILCVFEWVMLSILMLSILFLQRGEEIDSVLLLTSLVGAWTLVIPVAALLFTINYAGALYFPAWVTASAQQGPGVEKVGQRLIFFGGYVLVLAIALLPAVACGAVPFLVLRIYTEWTVLATILGVVTTGGVLVGELTLIFWWLGQRFERFDLSAELLRT
ncbi:MAG: putative ABC exporter domain-containing protein [Nibricoccus sp.]